MVLQNEDYEVIEGVFKPSAKAGLMADALYKSDGSIPTDDEIKSMSYKIGYYKDSLTSNRLTDFRKKAELYWRDRFIFEQNNPPSEKDRIYTDEKSYEILTKCLEAIETNNHIKTLLNQEISMNERTILMDIEMEVQGHESRVYKLKAKLDNFTIDSLTEEITVNDLKTTSRPASIFDPTYYSYQRELSFYSWLLRLVAEKFYGIKNPTVKGNFLVVSTADYTTSVVPMTKKLYTSGWKEALYLLKSVAYLNVIKGYEF